MQYFTLIKQSVRNWGVTQSLQAGQEQVGVRPEVTHPCVSKVGDRTFSKTAVKSEYSRAIHDELVNMLSREDHTRNEEYCEKIWRIQKE
jgi:predicted XRE-type DNA-binding protein